MDRAHLHVHGVDTHVHVLKEKGNLSSGIWCHPLKQSDCRGILVPICIFSSSSA